MEAGNSKAFFSKNWLCRVIENETFYWNLFPLLRYDWPILLNNQNRLLTVAIN